MGSGGWEGVGVGWGGRGLGHIAAVPVGSQSCFPPPSWSKDLRFPKTNAPWFSEFPEHLLRVRLAPPPQGTQQWTGQTRSCLMELMFQGEGL